MKVLTILIGLILIAAGVYLCFLWPEPVKFVLGGCLALGLILVGLGSVFFGMSEIRSAAEEARAAPPPPPAPTEGGNPEGQA